MNKKSTKRALLGSVLSLLLCCAMLIGTTFAWFTDSVSSNGNKIQSGTLKISLHKMEKDNTWTDISDTKDPLFNYNLWEPGYTAVQLLKVQNDGNLALKWQANLVYEGTVSKLAEVIDVYVTTNELTAYPIGREVVLGWEKKGTLKDFIDNFSAATKGELGASENKTAYLGIALHMQESANNDYQTLDLGATFDIQILATQNTVEEDSFDKYYDKDADYDGEISNAASLEAALKNGGVYKLTDNISLDKSLSSSDAETVIYLNGNSISGAGIVNNGTLTLNAAKSASTFSLRSRAIGNAVTVESGNAIKNNGTLTLNGVTVYSASTYGLNNAGTVTVNGGKINAIFNSGAAIIKDVTLANTISGIHGIYHCGSALTINGGMFSTTSRNGLIMAQGSNVTINDGTFTQIGKAYLLEPANAGIVINGGTFNGYVNDNGTNDTMRPGAAVVYGGTFNFEPTNWLADDSTVKSVEINGEYLVIDAEWNTTAVNGLLVKGGNEYRVYNAEGFAGLNAMMANKTAGKDVVVELMADIDMTGKTWTPIDSHADTAFSFKKLNGNGYTISNMTINGQAMFSRFADFGDVEIKDVTFDNATVKSSSINTAIIVGQSYQNVLLDNVDVVNSSITGGYKVAPLIATLYNESSSTVTATLKNCDIINTTVKATSYDFCTTGMVAFVYADDGEKIEFENCTVTDVTLTAPDDAYDAHAAVYTTGSESLYNEASGVAVTNCNFVPLS